jgi:hypothetical protein
MMKKKRGERVDGVVKKNFWANACSSGRTIAAINCEGQS